MRVTQSMMVNNMAYWASQQADKLSDAQTAVGSGKKINNPSDDPRAAGQIQSDRVSLSQYSQYESNIAQAKTWVGVSSATLDTVYTTLQNARNTVYSSGGTDIIPVETPTEATSSISPTINLNSNPAAPGTFSATINVYDADLNEIPLKITFTKVDATHWTWLATAPSPTTVAPIIPTTITFNAAGQLVGGTDQTITLTLTNEAPPPATTTQAITWNLSNADVAKGMTQYAAQSAISTDTTNIAIGLLTNSYNEVLSLANSLYASSYMYSGDLSATKPFANEVNIDSLPLPRVVDDIVFDLASAATSVDIQVSNSAGEVVRHITSAVSRTAGTNSIAWNGLADDGTTALDDGQYSYTVTALDGTIAVAAYHTYRGDDLNVEKEVLTGVNERLVLNNNGGDIFSDILNKISQALAAITAIGRIRATVPLDEAVLAVEEAKWINSGAELKKSITELETKQVALANASVLLGNASTRVQQFTNTTITRISELELGSPEEAAIKLQAQQTNYEQVISVTANVLQMPKLTDYI